jgi:hypothetical protein
MRSQDVQPNVKLYHMITTVNTHNIFGKTIEIFYISLQNSISKVRCQAI